MASGVPRVFECFRCKTEYNENESPSDDFCSQICQDVWVRVQSKKLDASFDTISVDAIVTPYSIINRSALPFRSEHG